MATTKRATTCRPILKRFGACGDAVKFAADLTPLQAWKKCERGDWLLWAAAKLNIDRKLIVRAACDCARQALKYVKAGEDLPRIAIETAERWCDGKATIEEVRKAAAAAYAADAAAADAAAYAGDAAADADAARAQSYKQSANLVRERIPWATVKAAIAHATGATP